LSRAIDTVMWPIAIIVASMFATCDEAPSTITPTEQRP
jgi:hypothetical protein